MSGVILLGPQRLQPTLIGAVRALGVPDDAPVATVTAGWQEREGDDAELNEHLGGRATNLRLYARAEAVLRRDPELAAAHHRRQEILKRIRSLYALRLRHAMAACEALLREPGDDLALERARGEAIEAVRELDRRHLERAREVHEEFDARFGPQARPAVAEERDQIAAVVRGAGATAVAGGHVAVLLNRLALFGLGELLAGSSVVAWSAGAMAIGERVVLFHDRPPHGPGFSEVLEHGLALAPGVVPFPHARHRLDLDHRARVAIAARRFAPALCLALDEGQGVRLMADGWVAAPLARRLDPAGVAEVMAA